MPKMRKRTKIIGIIVIVSITILAVYFRFNNHEQPEPELTPGVEFENVELVGIHQGNRQWELISRQIRQEKELFYLDQIEQVILFQEGQPKYYVCADHGIWNRDQGWLQLNNNVIVDDQEGFRLSTNKLIWHANEEVFKFTGDTVIVF